MESQQWLEHLRFRLAAADLPPVYIRRLVAELADHITDIVLEEKMMSMDATQSTPVVQRLGSVERLTKAAVAEYRQRGFASRHPWLAFVAAPVPAFLLIVVAYLLTLIGIATLLQGETVATRPVLMQLFEWVGHGAAFIPAALASALLCYQAIKSERDWRWQLVACSLVALFASLMVVGCQAPTEVGNGKISLGFGIGWSAIHFGQLMVPLCVAALSIGVQYRRTRSLRTEPKPVST